jgi:hypothetical protein
MFSQLKERIPRTRRKTWVRFQSEKSKTGSSSRKKKLRRDQSISKLTASKKLAKRMGYQLGLL